MCHDFFFLYQDRNTASAQFHPVLHTWMEQSARGEGDRAGQGLPAPGAGHRETTAALASSTLCSSEAEGAEVKGFERAPPAITL